MAVSEVLVGVDFSEYSKRVVSEARGLAQSLKVPLIMVHVFDTPIESGWQDGLMRSMLNERLKNEVVSFYKATEEIVLKRGKAYAQILAVAKKLKNPLIIVGHRGHSNIVERFFLGSTAERLSVKSPFPVIIYRGGRLGEIKKVLVPVDLSERVFTTLAGLKKLNFKKVKLELLHILTPPPPIFDQQDWSLFYAEYEEAARRDIANFRKKLAPLKLVTLMSNNISAEIRKRAKKFDLVAISPHGRNMFSSFGSVTAKVVRSVNTSVLVLPPAK